MSFTVTRTEYLEIQDYTLSFYIPLATPAWRVTNLSTLFEGPDVRGSNRVLPGVAGTKPFRLRVTETTKTLEMVVLGARSSDGTPYGDPHAGLETNLLYLVDHLATPPATATRTATLHLAGGGTLTAAVQVLKFRIGAGGGVDTTATLEIRIPAGRFA